MQPHPDVHPGVRRTLERRIRSWRAEHGYDRRTKRDRPKQDIQLRPLRKELGAKSCPVTLSPAVTA